MGLEIGILLAFLAMFGWGFGDFFIQKAVRKIGNWEPLFLITFFGAIALLPFVYKDIPLIFQSGSKDIAILISASLFLFVAAILDLEALKKGKLAIVEPLWSIEIPVGAIIAYIVFNEIISPVQIILIIFLVAGLFMLSLESLDVLKSFRLEKAVFLAISAATIMGTANFFIGWGARVSDPLMINWVINVVVATLSLIYLLFTKSVKRLILNLKGNTGTIVSMCLFDNIAWIAFAYAMVLAPIAIAVALSESYIIIVVLLGLFINKEKIRSHQKIGLVLAVVSAIVLASVS